MKALLIAAISLVTLIPTHAGAGWDGADQMIRERARQRVIKQRAFDACIAAAKTEAQIKECQEILKQKV